MAGSEVKKMKQEHAIHNQVTKTLPWWTWILPGLVCHLGTQMALHFEIAPGTAIWYPPIALSMVMINWWGPRILLGLYVNAMFSAGLWDLPRWYFWPLYALPETANVCLSWLFFTRLGKGKCWLPNVQETLRFIVWGMLIPITIGNLYLHIQFTMLGDFPAAQVWAEQLYCRYLWLSDPHGSIVDIADPGDGKTRPGSIARRVGRRLGMLGGSARQTVH